MSKIPFFERLRRFPKYFMKRIRETEPQAALSALALPLTVLFFGTVSIYVKNARELLFSLWSVALPMLGAALLCALVIYLIFVFCPRGVYGYCRSVTVAMTVMAVIQSTYLSEKSIAGDGGKEAEAGAVILSVCLWVLAVVIAVLAELLFRKKHGDILRLVATVLTVTAIGMQAIPLTVGIIDNRKAIFSSGTDKKYVLSDRGLGDFGSEANVFVFIIDRCDEEFSAAALRDHPEIFPDRDDFTYYDDNIAKYMITYPSVVYMLTGVEKPLEGMSREEYIDSSYKSSRYLRALKENGYDTGLYIDAYYGYENAASMRDYVSNAEPVTRIRLSDPRWMLGMMTELALANNLPAPFRGIARNVNSQNFASVVKYDSKNPVFDTLNKSIYDKISSDDFEFRITCKKKFSFIHTSGTHYPYITDEHFKPLTDESRKYDNTIGMTQSFRIINRYIDYMKENGLYDNATIIITGDHAPAGSELRRTALMVKRSGDYGRTPVSHSPVAQSQIMAEIFDSEGLTGYDFGTPLSKTPEDNKRSYIYFRYIDDRVYVGEIFVTGASRNPENVKRAEEKKIKGDWYD